MPITVRCAACNHQLRVKDEYAGKRGRCPKCGQNVTIPLLNAPEITAPPEPVAPPPPTQAPERPQLFARTDSGAVAVTFDETGWVFPEEEEPRPFGWLRRLLYQTFGMI